MSHESSELKVGCVYFETLVLGEAKGCGCSPCTTDSFYLSWLSGHMEEVVLYLFDNFLTHFLNQNNSSDGGKTCQQIRMMQPLLVIFAFSTNKSSHCYPKTQTQSVRDQTSATHRTYRTPRHLQRPEVQHQQRPFGMWMWPVGGRLCRRWVRYSTPPVWPSE